MHTDPGAGLLRRLEALVAAHQAALDAVLEMSGLSRLQFAVLAAVGSARGSASGTWIAWRCRIPRQAAHRVLRSLARRHLVDAPWADARRSTHVRYALSEWGASRLEICSTAMDSLAPAVAGCFTADEIETLCRLIGTLTRALRDAAAQTD